MSDKQFRCRAEVDAGFEPELERQEIKPKSFKEKLQNFWYYYKWHTVIGLFVVGVLAFGLAQCAMKEEPDYIVMAVFNKYLPSEVRDVIEGELEQYAKDLNGDGKVVVHLYDATLGTDSDMQKANSTRLMAEMQRGEAMLFIVDDACFNRLDSLDVFEKNELFPDKDSRAFNLRYTELTDKINEASDNYINHNYYIAKRVVKGTSFEKVKKSVESEKNNLELLEKFISSIQTDEK